MGNQSSAAGEARSGMALNESHDRHLIKTRSGRDIDHTRGSVNENPSAQLPLHQASLTPNMRRLKSFQTIPGP